LSVGVVNGLAINTGHELGHKKTNLERWLAKTVLAVVGYGHFFIELNRGHHKDVATPEDPASAKLGQTLYGFARAEILLSSANYIEHYGLLRRKLENGRYEPCQPHHSWNSNHVMSNVILFNLQRHSDHHANPTRRYQSLRSFEKLPELPSGYPLMFALALIPPLWFKVMDPKVVAWADGDLAKLNILPAARERLMRRYGGSQPERSA
jgi:hypothetical protein